MKRNQVIQQIVTTRQSTTLVQSKIIFAQPHLMILNKFLLEQRWLKPQCEAKYMSLFQRIVKYIKRKELNLTSQSSKSKSWRKSPIFSHYFDMTNIIKQFKVRIKQRISNDILNPRLNTNILINLHKNLNQKKKNVQSSNTNQIIKSKVQSQNQYVNSQKGIVDFKNEQIIQKVALQFNSIDKQNNMLFPNRNCLGLLEKSLYEKPETYGLQNYSKKNHMLFGHRKQLTFDFQKMSKQISEQKSLQVHNDYHLKSRQQVHKMKSSSPRKPLKSSRKMIEQKQLQVKSKKVKSQKSLGKLNMKFVKKK